MDELIAGPSRRALSLNLSSLFALDGGRLSRMDGLVDPRELADAAISSASLMRGT
jgi:hypothetical protein